MFDSVVGQEHITQTLKNAIRTNHLAQAFLFCGPRGVGKTTCARILAKTINCERLSNDVEPCSMCESCVSFQNNASFNIHELDAASNNSVEDIRNLIDQVRYPPQTGKYKIYIIDEVHMLSTSAFNAFLKTLEEPPSYAIFILATTEKHKILPTILSRCQIFDFNRIQPSDIANHLAKIATNESITADYEALELIAQKADGGLRDALSMFDLNVTFSKDGILHYTDVVENLHILDYDYYFRITDALLTQSIPQAFVLFDEILRKGFDGHQFLVGLLEHFRNLMVCKDAATVQLLQVSQSVQQKYLAQSQSTSLSFLLSALSIGSQCDINYKQAKNQRLHVEICLSKLAYLPAIFDIATLPEGEKKKDSSLAVGNEQPLINTENHQLSGNSEQTLTGENGVVYQKNPAVHSSTSVPNAKAELIASRLKTTVNLTQTAQPINGKTEQAQIEVIHNEPFTFEKLKTTWEDFADKRERPSEQVILRRDFHLKGNIIHLQLDNDIQTSLLDEFKADLLMYLRQHLRNSSLQLTAAVTLQEQKRMIYTQQEKFNFLAEKNPALLELRKVLGLELDY